MDVIRLRRGPKRDSTLDLISTKDSFAVRFKNQVSGSQAAKSMLKMPFVLGRNLYSRNTKCPPGLALFRVTPDEGSSSLPGISDPVTSMRDSTMDYLRSCIGKEKSVIASCYHTYQRANDNGPRSEEFVPSGTLFLEFYEKFPYEARREVFNNYKLLVDRAITYWEGAYVVSITKETGTNPVRLAEKLLQLEFKYQKEDLYIFDYVAPIFHRSRSLPVMPRDPLFNYQWHLRNDGLSFGKTGVDIRATEAWDITMGHEDVKVAVIDDAFDLTSKSFNAEQIISPLNVHDGSPDVSPRKNSDEWHGTSVLGIISASHKNYGGCGIAPDCPVIPIKLDALVDDDAEARAFDHAVKMGAAVINCSWGPYDNYSQDVWPLPRLTELAIENAYRNNVAVVFAAGNGSEDIKNDSYASNPCVIAVAASTDKDERAEYSDYGERVWVCAPSDGGGSGIVTADVREGGYNVFGDITPDFGGTSAAAPIVSGIIALMQSAFIKANPDKERLTVEEIRAILRLAARKEISDGAPKFGDYWDHDKLIDPAPCKPDGHSLAFGYGCVDAAESVRLASTWKRELKTDYPAKIPTATSKSKKDSVKITWPNILIKKLRENTNPIRREPELNKKGDRTSVKRDEVEFILPTHIVGDPFSIFYQNRESGLSSDDQSKFNAGEHMWLGDQGLKQACIAYNESYNNYVTIRRGEGKGNERFSYGEIVALSGDFYKTPDELFYEKPSWLSWLWEKNDTSDLKKYFKKEIEAIHKQMEGTEIAYPDFNIQFWWNAKNYTELAKNNESHFGWHNMATYCLYHEWALDNAIKAGAAKGEERDKLWRKSLYYNGFADHFLTDAFAAGHLRVPRKEIRDWAPKSGFSDTKGGFLSKLLHDQDGHRHTDHAQGERRENSKDGLYVMNSLGKEWHTFCDGQLFIKSKADSNHIRQPIKAVKESVFELFETRDSLEMPKGIFKATRHVPFPHPQEPEFVQKFDPNNDVQIKRWVESANWYELGVNEKSVKKLFKALPELMKHFRDSVKREAIKLEIRLPEEYINAFSSIK